ncbi:hypothetical protein SBADM41S_12086 [Streptomyces badius]
MLACRSLYGLRAGRGERDSRAVEDLSRSSPYPAVAALWQAAAMTARAADRTRYNRATAHLDAPIAIVDLEAFEANADDLVRRAAGKPVRVASKSVRCRALLERVLARPGFAGIMSYTLAESLWLARAGFDDVLLAYPSADRAAFAELAADPKLASTVTVMVDDHSQLELIDASRAGGREEIRVCLELDTSLRMLGGRVRIGALRSPLRSPAQLAELARSVARRPGFRLVGLMAYEGHVAGVGDAVAGPLRSRAIRLMQAAARKELAVRRAEVVRAVRAVAPELEFVNGGGTGSVQHTAAESAVTEIAAGSGLYVPRLFDNYTSFTARPAALFAQPVVRRPGVGVVTVLGGGYPASGAAGAGPLPGAVSAGGAALRPAGGRGRGADAAAGFPRRRSAHRRQGVVPARQGRGAVRALRHPAPDRGRPGHGERSDVPGRGADLPLTAPAPAPMPGQGLIDAPTPPLVSSSPSGRMPRVIVSISESGSSATSASKTSRTITGVPLPTDEGKATDCTYPPGPLPVVTCQRTR